MVSSMVWEKFKRLKIKDERLKIALRYEWRKIISYDYLSYLILQGYQDDCFMHTCITFFFFNPRSPRAESSD
jgi:hypothetical protein